MICRTFGVKRREGSAGGGGRGTSVSDRREKEVKREELKSVGLDMGAEAMNLNAISKLGFFVLNDATLDVRGRVMCLGAGVVVDIDVSARISARETEQK